MSGVQQSSAAEPVESAGWKPQPRPEWVTRLNQVGRIFGPAALVSLTAEDLLAAAVAATGLDDFGDDDWRVPFEILLADLEQSADLHLVGRLMYRYDLVRSLAARLRMRETEKQHPEILEQEITAPVFITGLGRTGTSILYELLAQDPQWHTPLGWEVRFPSPPPVAEERQTDPRVALAAADIDLWVQVVPEFLPIHETEALGPDEDVSGLMADFVSPVFYATGQVPNYQGWLMSPAGVALTYKAQRRLLQHLQFRTPGRWLVKGPAHIATLGALLAAYPDAQVVFTHRDPVKVMASAANMMSTLQWQRSETVRHQEYAQGLAFGYPMLLDMIGAQRADGSIPDDRVADVRYEDLVREPVATVRALYRDLGLDLSDDVAQAIQAYVDARPKGRHGGAGYRFSDLGLDEGALRSALAGYMGTYAVPEEAL
jgi:hypothetical protein